MDIDTTHRSRNYNERPDGASSIRAILLHSDEGTRESSLSWLCSPQSEVSSHYYVDREGTVYQLVDDDKRAWHAGVSRYAGIGDWNDASIGVEVEHRAGQGTYPPQQLAALSALCRHLIARYAIAQSHIAAHRWVARPAGRKRDPSDLSDDDLHAFIALLYEAAPVSSPEPTSPELITSDSPLLAPPRASAAQAIAYIVQLGSVYTAEDITTIVGHYWRYGVECGIDPLLAIAQCIHETSAQQPDGRWFPLSSWWSQRPRRNSAGIGVTGVIQRERPPDVVGWTQDEQGRWHQGLHFADWSWSAQAHLGRLLAYALAEGTETSTQRRLVVYALNLRRLPDEYRGAAPTLAGLAGRWAVPGRGYDQRIAGIANEIVRRPQ